MRLEIIIVKTVLVVDQGHRRVLRNAQSTTEIGDDYVVLSSFYFL